MKRLSRKEFVVIVIVIGATAISILAFKGWIDALRFERWQDLFDVCQDDLFRVSKLMCDDACIGAYNYRSQDYLVDVNGTCVCEDGRQLSDYYIDELPEACAMLQEETGFNFTNLLGE